MVNTLVIVLAETRAHELTFENFKRNVIDELGADLCLCIGVKSDYDYENPFYKLAKYHFLYNEEDDLNFAKSVEYSYKETQKKEFEYFKDKYVKHKHYTDFYELRSRIGSCLIEYSDTFWNFITSTYIHIFFLWFLQKNMRESGLLSKYERFVILRSDYIYNLPFPKMEVLNEQYIWIPDSEDYSGICDRSVVLSATHFEHYINILESFYIKSNRYYEIIESQFDWNMEKILKMHLDENHLFGYVRRFPYIGYSVRNVNGTTRWSGGEFSETHGYYIKYPTEYDKSMHYKQLFENSNCASIDEFYCSIVQTIN